MSFTERINDYDWNKIESCLYNKTAKDVEIDLGKTRPTIEDLMAMV